MQRPLLKQGPLHFSYIKNEISYVNGLLCDLYSTFTLNRAGFFRNFLFFLLLKKLKGRSYRFCLLLKRLWIYPWFG